jgi:hypothetical protein
MTEPKASDVAKADRYIAWLRRQDCDKSAAKFYKLAVQAMERNDFRICEMAYAWAEFECSRK